MTPYFSDGSVTIYHGDAMETLRSLPDESVNCCVTSPPYWGLRDYGTAEWEGSTECDHKVGGQVQDKKAPGAITTGQRTVSDSSVCRKCGAIRIDKQIGLESTPDKYVNKMVEVFQEVRRVLRNDGTVWLNLGDSYASHPGQRKYGVERTDVAGWKQQTNAGCLTIGSRTAQGLKAKDLVGIPWRVALALQSDGWWLRSDIIWAKSNPMPESVDDRPTRSHEYIFLLAKSEQYYYDAAAIAEKAVSIDLKKFTDGGTDKQRGHSRRHAGFNGRYAESLAVNGVPTTRNKRDVWNINTEPFPEAHFAVFPPPLILPCVLAGCPPDGVVLDPFGGALTTMLVAKENGRRGISCDLNAEYLNIGIRRISQEVLAF